MLIVILIVIDPTLSRHVDCDFDCDWRWQGQIHFPLSVTLPKPHFPFQLSPLT